MMHAAQTSRAALLVLALAAAGCGAAQRDPEPLDQAVRVYNEGVRWQRFDDAASRLPADRRDDFLDQQDQLHDDLRISEYDVIRVRYDGKQRRARVQIKYTWYLESRGVVHETHAVQTWHRGDEIWVMRGERYLRGERMPGLKDAKAKGADGAEAEADDAEADDAEAGDAEPPEPPGHDLDVPAEGDPEPPPPGS
jgi:hypothetical protein